MSAIQNIVLEYIFIWTVGRNYFKLVTMKEEFEEPLEYDDDDEEAEEEYEDYGES